MNFVPTRWQWRTAPDPISLKRTDWKRTRDKGIAASGNSTAIPPSETFRARVRVIFNLPLVSSHETCRTPESTAYRRCRRRSLRFNALQLVSLAPEALIFREPD